MLSIKISPLLQFVSFGAGDKQPPCSAHAGYITGSRVTDDAEQ